MSSERVLLAAAAAAMLAAAAAFSVPVPSRLSGVARHSLASLTRGVGCAARRPAQQLGLSMLLEGGSIVECVDSGVIKVFLFCLLPALTNSDSTFLLLTLMSRQSALHSKELPLIVAFCAEWCGPCKVLSSQVLFLQL